MLLCYLGKVLNSIVYSVCASGEDEKIIEGDYKGSTLAFKQYFFRYWKNYMRMDFEFHIEISLLISWSDHIIYGVLRNAFSYEIFNSSL